MDMPIPGTGLMLDLWSKGECQDLSKHDLPMSRSVRLGLFTPQTNLVPHGGPYCVLIELGASNATYRVNRDHLGLNRVKNKPVPCPLAIDHKNIRLTSGIELITSASSFYVLVT